MIFARDFPINLEPRESETDTFVNGGFYGVLSPDNKCRAQLVGTTTDGRRQRTDEGVARLLSGSSQPDEGLLQAGGVPSNNTGKRMNNNKANAAPDTRLSRDPLPGEIKFKQIKLTNKKTNFEVNLLVRR